MTNKLDNGYKYKHNINKKDIKKKTGNLKKQIIINTKLLKCVNSKEEYDECLKNIKKLKSKLNHSQKTK